MKKVFIKLIRFYQKYISSNTKAHCKYYPTCSNYAIEAISTYGFFKGWGLTIRRILRCNPFGGSGYDPVPVKKKSNIKISSK